MHIRADENAIISSRNVQTLERNELLHRLIYNSHGGQFYNA
jgi:hypothetical protein